MKTHAQLVDKFQEVNRSWLQYLRSEADLSAEFTPKMITARLIPSAATVLLEWTNRHMEMAAVDAKHVLADTQEIMEIGLRLLPGGWLFNGKGRGSSISAAAAGFPFPASPCGMAQDRVCLRIKGNDGKPISEATLKRHFAHELTVGKVEVETKVLTQFMAAIMRGERWAICKYMDQQMWRPEDGAGAAT